MTTSSIDRAADTSKTAAQRAYEAAPGALYRIMPWEVLSPYWQAYWATRSAEAT